MLSSQRAFRCRHSGVCCSSAWHIPVDIPTYDTVTAQLAGGSLRLPDGPWTGEAAWIDTGHPPHGSAGILRVRPDGACVFFERRADGGCALQGAAGHDALPLACQQFPRVTVIDDRGAHVALSHHCPTVAAMLVEGDGEPVTVVDLAHGDPVRRQPEGFDARGTIPPFLRPGVAFDLEAWDFWERGVVEAFGRPGGDDGAALAAVARAAERIRSWRPVDGTLAATVARERAALTAWERTPSPSERADDLAANARLFEDVVSSVPDGLAHPDLPAGWAAIDEARVAPRWRHLSAPVGRFLSAKAIASSLPWQGDGVRIHVMGVAAARAVLRVELARRAVAADREADAAMLVEAARAADLLLEHLSDRATLAARWRGIEEMTPAAFLTRIGCGAPA